MAANQSKPNGSGGGSQSTAGQSRTGRVVDGMQDRFREASEDVRHGAEKASDEIRRGYERASHAAREGYDRVERDLQGVSRSVNAYVKDNPGKSLILASAAGFLLGLLMSSEED